MLHKSPAGPWWGEICVFGVYFSFFKNKGISVIYAWIISGVLPLKCTPLRGTVTGAFHTCTGYEIPNN